MVALSVWTVCEVLTLNSPPVTHVAERRLTDRLATYLPFLLTYSKRKLHSLSTLKNDDDGPLDVLRIVSSGLVDVLPNVFVAPRVSYDRNRCVGGAFLL